MAGKLFRQDVKLCILQNFTNRWVELGLPNGHFFKFYIGYLNPNYIGGYLSRGSYKTLYCPPLQSCINLPECVPQINNWVILEFQKSQFLWFFLTYLDENFLGGYLMPKMIKTVDFTIVHYQHFFEEYDRRFHPALLSQNSQIPLKERERRKQLVKRAEQVLLKRLKNRALAAKDGIIPNHNDMPTLDFNDVQYLSNKQLELYKEFFLDKKGNFDYKKIQTCFELFNNGEIQGNKYPGNLQPDSASEFLFAEFALQAIEYNIKSEIWSELLKTFVKTQQIFIQVYRPNGIKIPDLGDYRYSNFKYYKQVGDKQKERLRKKYDYMSKEELEQAYSKNLILAQSANYFI